MIAHSKRLLAGPTAVEKVTGERVHYSTYFRWTQRGIRVPGGDRIRLEFVKVGSKRLTSIESVERFVSAVTAASGQPLCPLLAPDSDGLAQQLAEEGL